MYSNDVILLSFNSSYKRDSFSEFYFIDNIQERNIYSIITIGEPEYKIKTILSFDYPYFYLIPNKFVKAINNSSFKNYNYSNSITFQNITCLNEYILESKNDIIAKERFKIHVFNYKKNITRELVINDMNFILGINDNFKDNIYYLNIGFRIISENDDLNKQNYSFIYQLKKRKIINNYCWHIYFDLGNNKEGKFLYNADKLFNATGKLIIGDLPSNYQPNKFHKSQFLTTYSYAKDLMNTWAIQFNNIYYYNQKNNIVLNIVKDTYFKAHFNINNYLIQAPNTYYYHIKNDFFNEYLSKGLCNIYTGNGFEAIYCQKSEYFSEDNLKQFPILYLQNNELQYIFEFNYEDLFLEIDEQYWFLITFPIFYELEEWFFGIIFLRKYNLVFMQDSKTIGFYNPKLPIEEENIIDKNHRKLNIKIIILIIIILGILSIGLGIYLGKIIYMNKKVKKRFNELDDSFDYVSKDNYESKDENIEPFSNDI